MSRNRPALAPPRLRRRFRDCRDISGASRLPCAVVVTRRSTPRVPLRSESAAMNPETAELAIPERASELPRAAARALARRRAGAALGGAGAAAGGRRAHGARCATAGARCGPRGCSSASRASPRPGRSASAPRATPSTRPASRGGFGRVADLLAAPVARWDSAWYLVIAQVRLRARTSARSRRRVPRTSRCTRSVMRVLGRSGLPLIAAGVLISLCAFALALYGIHRLTTLELGTRAPPARARARRERTSRGWRCSSRPSRRWRSSSRRSTPSALHGALGRAVLVGAHTAAGRGRARSARSPQRPAAPG